MMRFLFQDEGAKLATKCIRVSSKSSTDDVIETLVEKFRPDMKMLTTPIYYLLEVDSNGSELPPPLPLITLIVFDNRTQRQLHCTQAVYPLSPSVTLIVVDLRNAYYLCRQCNGMQQCRYANSTAC